MKTTFKILTALTLFTGVAVTACQKENTSRKADRSPTKLPQPSVNLQKPPLAIADPAANPANPVDSVGRIHNMALDFVDRQTSLSGNNSSTERIGRLALFFQKRYGKDITKNLQDLARFNEINIPAPSQAIKLTQKFKPVMQSYLQEIIDQINSVKAVEDFSKVKQQLVSLESKAAADRNLTPTEKMKIASVASVARYSLWYWLQQANTTSSAGAQQTMGIFHRIWRAINIALADTEGAISGIYYLEPIREILEDASLNSAIASAFS